MHVSGKTESSGTHGAHRHAVVSAASAVLFAGVLIVLAKAFIQPAEGTSDGERSFQSGIYQVAEQTSTLHAQAVPEAPYSAASEASVDPAFCNGASGEVVFSHKAGCYDTPFELSLRGPDGWRIRYTLDGSEPNELSEPYDIPISIDFSTAGFGDLISSDNVSKMHLNDFSTPFVPQSDDVPKAVVVRARAFSPDGEETPTVTRTFFLEDNLIGAFNDTAVISMVTDPANLLDYETGIYTPGKIYDEWKLGSDGMQAIVNGELWFATGNYAQHGREWERPASIELFDGTNACSFASTCGIRIHGGASRCNDQRSWNIYFRKDYGAKTAEYEFFPGEKDQDGQTLLSYKSLTLRAGGNDTDYIKFKDAYLQDLLSGLDLETQASRPAVLFVNGTYWGCYTMQEKYSDAGLAASYCLDKDDIIIVKDGAIDDGRDSDAALYEELLSYAEKDLSDDDNWRAFEQIADVQSMADYFAAQIYIGNVDYLPDRNYALWRTRSRVDGSQKGDGKWRWMLYDTEYSSGIYPYPGDVITPSYDSLIDAAMNHPLFLSALANRHFQELLVSSLIHISANCMSYDLAMSRLSEYLEAYQPLMAGHYARFGNTSWSYQPNIDSMCDYLSKRGSFILPAVEDDIWDHDHLVALIESRRASLLGIPIPSDSDATPMMLPALVEVQENPEQAEAGADLAEQLAEQIQQGIAEDVALQ